jgi:hypothetical protein
LKKVFREELHVEENADTAEVAKGETATFQFVIRSLYPVKDLKIEANSLVRGDKRIAASLKAFVGYIQAGSHASPPSKDAVFPLSDCYPDCLQEVESVDVQPLSNQPVWVSYAVPRDAQEGDYSANLVFTGTVNGRKFKLEKQVNAKVYNVVLPEQTLWLTSWFGRNLLKMNNNEPVEPYSDRYWELLKALAHIMRDHGHNTYLFFDLPELCKAEWNGERYTFDFTNFDRMVELFIREGGLKRIEGDHLAHRIDGWDSDFGVHVPNLKGRTPIEDKSALLFLSQYLPALYGHLESRGWTDMYIQHIADEPVDSNAESYSRIAKFVKQTAPKMKIIDAVMSRRLSNTVDIWVPLIDHYHKDYDFYRERQAAGDEVWFYTCCNPQGNYANRFLEQPLVQMRILHWINYRYGATGYLHWGFNWWNLSTTNTAKPDHETWPGGDSWIVYPAYGKVYSSIRLEALRDGIADYELLKLLEQKAPDKAKKLANAIVKGFDKYDSNITVFRRVRCNLLTWLSE